MVRGNLILIEGLDRTGKSTQAGILKERLSECKLIKFPERSMPIGKVINQYLTDESFELSDQSAHLLFLANRWEVAKSIEEDLKKGKSIVLDRYVYSGIAYSLAKLRLNKSKEMTDCSEMADVNWLKGPDRGLPKPDLTLFLSIDPDILSGRDNWGEERYEKQDFQKLVRECFFEIFDDSVCILDVNNKSIEDVLVMIWDRVVRSNMHEFGDKPLQRFG